MLRSSIQKLAAQRHAILSISNKPITTTSKRFFTNTLKNSKRTNYQQFGKGTNKQFSTFNKTNRVTTFSSKQNNSSSATIFTICLTSCAGFASVLHAKANNNNAGYMGVSPTQRKYKKSSMTIFDTFDAAFTNSVTYSLHSMTHSQTR